MRIEKHVGRVLLNPPVCNPKSKIGTLGLQQAVQAALILLGLERSNQITSQE